MAQTIQGQLQPGKTVLLIAGRGHVLRSVGVPTWLPAEVRSSIAIAQAGDRAVVTSGDTDYVVRTAAVPAVDHCAQLRQQWRHPTKP